LRLERPKDYYDQFNCRIPFLNGGLFDPINDYDWQDTDIEIPDEIFSNNSKTKEGDIGDGILDIFDRYNFTVKEDEPLEKEVAIDPEMLGKVFENLLEVKDRKSKGTYYTPREIVHYMCQESLANYLTTELNCNTDISVCSKKEIDILIKYGETAVEHDATYLEKTAGNESYKGRYDKAKLPDSIRQHAKLIDEKLASIRVCDPAVGSGAFPVGMMNEIIRTRNALTPYIESNIDIPVCDSDIHITHRNLPHWTKDGSIYWITFRLADSLPHEKLDNWKTERNQWVSKHPEPWSELEWKEYNERFGDRLEGWLDAGYGCCVLSRPEVRKILQECLLRFDEERLRIHAAVIMPNHIHLLLSPLKNHSLSELLKGIKGASARRINHLLGKTGTTFWMDESYDHIVRSEAQYQHFLTYITENPVKAGLSQNQYWLYQSVKSSTGISACVDLSSQTRMSVPRSSYHFKRHAIQNCLYGVDIDPGAVEIAKLRLWLSLVVDEEDIKQIKPLPNLDYKIVCGNSLLGVEKNLFNADLFNELEELKPLYFNETNASKKQEYKNQIDELISQITNGHKDFDFEVYFSEVFHEKKGFDVVIANPPYVKEYVNRAAFDDLRGSPYYQGKMDLWYLFACKGIDTLKDKGILTFIAQNNWVTSYGASKMRNKVIQDTQILSLIDFGAFKIFEAGIQTMVMIFKRSTDAENYSFDYRRLLGNELKIDDVVGLLDRKTSPKSEYLTPKIQRDQFINNLLTFSASDIQSILEKTSEKSDFSLDPQKEVAQGIVCPQDYLNKAGQKILGEDFKIGEGIFTLSTRELKALQLSKTELQLIKPFYTTDELNRWKANPYNRKWIIYTDSSFKDKKKIESYPNIKKHLDRFKKVITSDNKPYGLHRARDESFFKGEKIIAVRKCARPTFTYVDFDSYVSATFYVIKTRRVNQKYLIGVLNSRLIEFWLRRKGKMQGTNYQIDKEPLVNLPLVEANKNTQEAIANVVDKILAITKSGTGIPACDLKTQTRMSVLQYEKQIDQMVYELYGLTPEEIKIVEGFGKED